MSAKQVVGVGTAAMRHDRMVTAYDAQRARFAGSERDAWAGRAQNFKLDPRRPLDALLEKIASYVREDDTLIDVGGGAGRLSLPLAPRCKDVVIVDPSAGMRQAFEAALEGSGISNARFVQSGWLEAEAIAGDVALVTHVTYFVPQIAPFTEKLQASTGRRVIVGVRSVPPPNQIAGFFQLAHDEQLAPVPGHEELLAVLNELGIAAELIDVGPAAVATTSIGKTREDSIRIETESAVSAGWLREEEKKRLRRLIDEHFDELFAETDKGYWRQSAIDARDLLITWETS